MSQIQDLLRSLEARIAQIEERNRAVDTAKAWEVSLTRRVVIAVFTYLAAAAYLVAIGERNPLVMSCIPAGGYLISTQTLPFIRGWWSERLKSQGDL